MNNDYGSVILRKLTYYSMVQFLQEGKQNIGFLIIENEYLKPSLAMRSHLLYVHHTIYTI